MFRQSRLLLAAVVLTAGCSSAATAPTGLDEAALSAQSGQVMATNDLAAPGPAACDASKATPLSDAQKAQIKALFDAFESANKADLQTVRQAMDDAMKAIKAGAQPARVIGILEGARAAAERLAPLQQRLRNQIAAILTPEQLANPCVLGGRFRPGPRGP